jgi:hypothetical protein
MMDLFEWRIETVPSGRHIGSPGFQPRVKNGHRIIAPHESLKDEKTPCGASSCSNKSGYTDVHNKSFNTTIDRLLNADHSETSLNIAMIPPNALFIDRLMKFADNNPRNTLPAI